MRTQEAAHRQEVRESSRERTAGSPCWVEQCSPKSHALPGPLQRDRVWKQGCLQM